MGYAPNLDSTSYNFYSYQRLFKKRQRLFLSIVVTRAHGQILEAGLVLLEEQLYGEGVP